MPTSINLPVLLAQLPHLSKLTSVEQARPEAQTALSEQRAREEALRRQHSVEEVEKQERSKVVDDESKDGSSKQDRHMRDRKDHSAKEKDDPKKSPSKSPWSGNIVNMKI
ncbi:hypothetical protein ACI3L3_08225 [Desulfobaculum sp. SPO524]|uniref:hypothetical protein n=1 Tax=Desulfobaculum sp. SPO524 TaxID=3378071 RepID=UPI003854D5F8